MRKKLYLVLFVLFGALLFFPIFSAGFAGDDYPQLVNMKYFHTINAAVSVFSTVFISPSGHTLLLGYFYRPLPFAIYTLLYYFSHANPFYFHIAQFVFYMGAVCLLYLFYTTFFSQKISLLLSFIFFIHPANNELVAYIAALHDTLSLFFGMLALVCLSKIKRQSFWVVCLVCLCLLLSLLAKEAGILFLLLAGAYSLYKKTFKLYVFPFLFTVGVYLVFRIHASFHPVFSFISSPPVTKSFAQRILLAPQIALAFMKEIIVPTRVSIRPNFFRAEWQQNILPLFIICLFILVSIIFGIWLKKYHKKNIAMFLFFFSWIIFGVLFYVQIIPLELLFAERWLYIAEIGILGVFGTVLYSVPLKRNKWLVVCLVLFGLYLLLFTAETYIFNTMWHDWLHHF